MRTVHILCLTALVLSLSYASINARVLGPHAIVYKTRKDFSKLVPVTLSADGKQIVSYPATTDLKAGDKLLYPTHLHQGYLLDNKGIGANTAFLNISYERYAALTSTPSLKQLQRMILSRSPFKELCDCGPLNKYADPQRELNLLIDKGLLKKKCKTISVR